MRPLPLMAFALGVVAAMAAQVSSAQAGAAIDGRIEMREPMEGPPRPTLVVDRFVEIVPGERCIA